MMILYSIADIICNKLVFPTYNSYELKSPPTTYIYLQLIQMYCIENNISINTKQDKLIYKYIDEIMFGESSVFYTIDIFNIKNISQTLGVGDYVFHKGRKKIIEWIGICTFKCI